MINTQRMKRDVLIIGGGTAGTMAAIKAKQANSETDVLVLEKANIRRSGAIAMGMDGVHTAPLNIQVCEEMLRSLLVISAIHLY